MQFNKDWYNNYRQQVTQEILDVTAKKNNDYTTGNGENGSQNPFANFDKAKEFGVDSLTGLCIRMEDKFQRAKTFAKDGKLAVTEGNDSTKDIFFDLAGYCLLAMGMIERDKHIQD